MNRAYNPARLAPKVTVLIPVHNRPQFVDEAIRSVVQQDFDDFELLVVDDGSTDDTAAVLESWRRRDPRVVVVTSPTNLGIPAALNLGLSHASGAFIARLDSDDLMRPHRLAAQVAVLENRREVTLVSSAYEIVDLAGNHLHTWKGDEPHEVMAFLLNFYNAVGGGGQIMFRRDDVLDEGGFSVDHPATEDYELWVRLLRRGRFLPLPLVGMIKRAHEGQAGRRSASVKRGHWTSIMRSSLERSLQRTLHDDEIEALLTVWRLDGALGKSAVADRVIREAFARFTRAVNDPALRTRAQRCIARQWYLAARNFVRRRHPVEAVRYVIRGATWLLPLPQHK